MESSYIFIIILLLLVILPQLQEEKLISQYIRRKKKKGDRTMTEAIKNFIGKECIIYLMSGQVTGVIKDVSGNSVSIETKTDTQLINTDFIVRVREYPKDKNGKRKSVVFD